MSTPASYEDIPYRSGAFEQSHPDRLAAMARLFGLAAPPPERARVLEIGCACGANLIPMACSLPASTFVGVDLSPTQIDIARATAAPFQLTNLQLLAEDLCALDGDLGDRLGPFDYIIAHGVFSWVPRAAQDRLLALCGRLLSPDGVAYISYNTYPGWYPSLMLRELSLFHNRGAKSPQEQAARARALITFLAEQAPQRETAYRALLQHERNRLASYSDTALLHDELEATSEPIYFHAFMSRAASAGLQFLSEALFAEMQDAYVPEPARALLAEAGDLIAHEQYRDILRNRRFRETLLCRAEVPLDRDLGPGRLEGFYYESLLPAAPGKIDLGEGQAVEFSRPRGNTIGLRVPAAKAALYHLSQVAPRALSFPELLQATRALTRTEREDDAAHICEMLFGAYTANLLKLHALRPEMATVPGPRPLAPALCRKQAETGVLMTNLWHRMVQIDDVPARYLLAGLDGKRDRAALAAYLAKGLNIPRAQAGRELDSMLRGLGHHGLLIR